ncbi:DUF4363 family protein [Clostridium kluyveri]|uniref:DUF4363 domain-containing protein n=1 Tax=Clostridium kluyveri TaxID=1534 RepID=A0A1L5FD51_CLOKL|nr:DUF4363 family protein [Clostridium kluyveri]APM40942.1 hypothetical protein BS101_20630 [Clostridium kluyveri]UZQ48782.1 DUF4363 family protein [Clostridium kluyveri]
MKNTIISFSIFILMLFSIIFSIKYLNNTCIKLQNLNVKIEQAIQANDWEESYKNSEHLMAEWKKYSSKLSIFSNHHEIDDINNELWKLIHYTTYKNKEEALISVNIIKNSIYSILHMQQLNIENLF